MSSKQHIHTNSKESHPLLMAHKSAGCSVSSDLNIIPTVFVSPSKSPPGSPMAASPTQRAGCCALMLPFRGWTRKVKRVFQRARAGKRAQLSVQALPLLKANNPVGDGLTHSDDTTFADKVAQKLPDSPVRQTASQFTIPTGTQTAAAPLDSSLSLSASSVLTPELFIFCHFFMAVTKAIQQRTQPATAAQPANPPPPHPHPHHDGCQPVVGYENGHQFSWDRPFHGGNCVVHDHRGSDVVPPPALMSPFVATSQTCENPHCLFLHQTMMAPTSCEFVGGERAFSSPCDHSSPSANHRKRRQQSITIATQDRDTVSNFHGPVNVNPWNFDEDTADGYSWNPEGQGVRYGERGYKYTRFDAEKGGPRMRTFQDQRAQDDCQGVGQSPCANSLLNALNQTAGCSYDPGSTSWRTVSTFTAPPCSDNEAGEKDWKRELVRHWTSPTQQDTPFPPSHYNHQGFDAAPPADVSTFAASHYNYQGFNAAPTADLSTFGCCLVDKITQLELYGLQVTKPGLEAILQLGVIDQQTMHELQAWRCISHAGWDYVNDNVPLYIISNDEAHLMHLAASVAAPAPDLVMDQSNADGEQTGDTRALPCLQPAISPTAQRLLCELLDLDLDGLELSPASAAALLGSDDVTWEDFQQLAAMGYVKLLQSEPSQQHSIFLVTLRAAVWDADRMSGLAAPALLPSNCTDQSASARPEDCLLADAPQQNVMQTPFQDGPHAPRDSNVVPRGSCSDHVGASLPQSPVIQDSMVLWESSKDGGDSLMSTGSGGDVGSGDNMMDEKMEAKFQEAKAKILGLWLQDVQVTVGQLNDVLDIKLDRAVLKRLEDEGLVRLIVRASPLEVRMGW